jgi:hypothetical protein
MPVISITCVDFTAKFGLMILYRPGRDFASLCQIDSLAEDTTDAPRSFSPSL